MAPASGPISVLLILCFIFGPVRFVRFVCLFRSFLILSLLATRYSLLAVQLYYQGGTRSRVDTEGIITRSLIAYACDCGVSP